MNKYAEQAYMNLRLPFTSLPAARLSTTDITQVRHRMLMPCSLSESIAQPQSLTATEYRALRSKVLSVLVSGNSNRLKIVVNVNAANPMT